MDLTAEQSTRCLTLCKEHLGGAWAKISPEQKEKIVKRVSGGLSNYLFSAQLPDELETVRGEPRNVLIRFYGPIVKGNSQAILKDSLVFALLAQQGLGPLFYGSFEDGRFEEFIPTRCLTTAEMPEVKTMEQLTAKLATLHKLNMPLKKEPMVVDQMREWYKNAMNNSEVIRTHDEEVWKEFLSLNIGEEMETLISILLKCGSPIVFAHNDCQEGNILLGRNGADYKLIDFEYAGYNFRGHEFANHFLEWCYCYACDEHPYFHENLENFPTDNQQRQFFRLYLTAQGMPVDQQEGEIIKLLNETQVCIMSVHFFWSLWAFVSICTSSIQFGYMEWGIRRMRRYFEHKSKLLKTRPDLILM